MYCPVDIIYIFYEVDVSKLDCFVCLESTRFPVSNVLSRDRLFASSLWSAVLL